MKEIIIAIVITFSITITIKIVLKITGHLDLNRLFIYIRNCYITKKYNKMANDYCRLFNYFSNGLAKSPSGMLIQYIMENYGVMEFYIDYENKKIFILKNDKIRKEKANKKYALELKKFSQSNFDEVEKYDNIFNKKDFFYHKNLSKDFKYYLKLEKILESNYNFQQVVQSKWLNEVNMKIKKINIS